MIINLIVIRQPGTVEDTFWTSEAWDEYTIDENPEGFDEAIEKAHKEYGGDHVRVLQVRIPKGSLAKPFEVPTVEGTPIPRR